MSRELILSSLADNGSFALEYFLLGVPNKDNLLKDGIEYCGLFEESVYRPDSYIYLKDELIYTIRKYYTHKQLLEYMEIANEIRDTLLDILQKNKIVLSEEKIRSYQHFFNETSGIFLAAEMKKMKNNRNIRFCCGLNK